jgi:hypothetical protein
VIHAENRDDGLHHVRVAFWIELSRLSVDPFRYGGEELVWRITRSAAARAKLLERGLDADGVVIVANTKELE